jgi:cell division protease FtsH
LEKVTKQAHAMVSVYGLNDRIGNVSYYDSQRDSTFTKPFSEETARIIDEEVSKVIEQAYDKALEILSQNKDKLIEVAEALLKHEVIFKVDVERILGRRPFEKQEEPKVIDEAPKDLTSESSSPEAE